MLSSVGSFDPTAARMSRPAGRGSPRARPAASAPRGRAGIKQYDGHRAHVQQPLRLADELLHQLPMRGDEHDPFCQPQRGQHPRRARHAALRQL
eukprot:5118839-Pyramimonas_sp.AAC.1